MIFLTACNSSNDNSIDSIQNEMHYMETDNEREYAITFLEDGRADVAWYGREDDPESVTYSVSEEPIEVENQEPMKKITFDNFPSHSYGLSNTNDNSFLIDDTEDEIVLRDYKENDTGENVLRKDLDEARVKATEERDIFLVNGE